MQDSLNVCVVSISPPDTAETFIRAHIDRLPFSVTTIYGNELPYSFDGKSLRDIRKSPSSEFASRLLNLLPRIVEFRLRSRLFPRATDTDVLADFLRSHKIDVVLAEYGTVAATVTEALKIAGVPLVAHFHGFDASRTRILSAFAERYKTMFDYASKVIVVSHSMSAAVKDLGCAPEKLTLNPYGPDPAYFGVNPDCESNMVLAVGRLTDKKAPHLTILAFKEALRTQPELRLTIIGEGPLRGVCADLISAEGLGDKVFLAGERSPEQIQMMMGKSFLFLQHSVVASDGDSEGTPVAILEAGAASLPVVATRHAGIPDVVISGATGILVDERDVSAMARAIVDLATNRNLAGKMGSAARQRIASEFSMERHIARLAGALRDSSVRKNV